MSLLKSRGRSLSASVRGARPHFFPARRVCPDRARAMSFVVIESRFGLVYDRRTMPKAKSPIPEGFRTLTPHLTVNGAEKYIDFLKRAFNAVEVSRSPGPAGKLMHAH